MTQFLLSPALLDQTRGWPEPDQARLMGVLDGLTQSNNPQELPTAPLPARPDFALARVNKDNVLLFCRRRDGAIEAHDVLPTPPSQQASPIPEVAEALSPLSYCSLDQLLAWGVPKNRIKEVRLARTQADLAALALPPQVTARLATQLAAGTQALATSIPAFLQYRVDSLATLQQWYQGQLTRLLLNLTREQEYIVDVNASGPVLVNGVAGSGKTTVALYRMKRLAEAAGGLLNPRILYLTYNKSLRDCAKQLLEGLGSKVASLEVRNIHQWCKKALGNSWTEPLKDADRTNLLKTAIEKVRGTGATSGVFDAPLEFWKDEIGQVIKGRALLQWPEYSIASRYGRVRPLTVAAREVVWRVYETYEQMKGMRMDWDDVIPATLAQINASSSFEAYDHVFVDEAQDLPPIAMGLAVKLGGGRSASLLITADPAQSIYQRGFRWQDTGVSVVGRSYSLKQNYRSTEQILTAAAPLPATANIGDRDALTPVGSNRVGPKPRLVTCDDMQHQVKWAASEIRSLIVEAGVPPGNIAVLARWPWLVKKLCNELNGVAVPAAYYKYQVNLADPKVKAITIHSGKGLEFPVVFLVGVDQTQFFPTWDQTPEEDKPDILQRARKLLYVGMTRAMQDLTITCSSAAPAKDLLDLLSAEHVERSRVKRELESSAAPPNAESTALEVIDKRPQGGCLWVIDGPGLAATLHQKFLGKQFSFAPKGGSATGHRAAWYAK